MKKRKPKRKSLNVGQLIALMEMIADSNTFVEIEANLKDAPVGFAEWKGNRIILRKGASK